MRKRSEPSERARVVVNLRVLPALRLELDAAAQQNGRTLSSEIEARLAESLGHRPAAPDLRTLIREELEADRKRQAADLAASVADLCVAYGVKPPHEKPAWPPEQ